MAAAAAFELLLEQAFALTGIPGNDERLVDDLHAVLEGGRASRLPLLFWRRQNTKAPGCTFSLREQFFDREKMLHGQLEEVLLSGAENCGAPLCLRPNFGTIFLPACLGLEFTVPEDAYPWLTGRLGREEFVRDGERLLSQVGRSSLMQRALDYIGWFREILPSHIHVYMPDTQGPFDLAHLIYGDQLFYDLYDDPGFVHELMEFAAALYIDATLLLKQALGEPEDQCWHGHALIQGIHMRNGGIRISEDTATLLSPDHIDEFVIPYDGRALERFGGGFIHYCGRNEHLLDAYCRLDGVRAINFGNPEMHAFGPTMGHFRQAGVCCFGKWPILSGESPSDYFARIGSLTNGGREGIILHLDAAEFSPLGFREIERLSRQLPSSEEEAEDESAGAE